MRSQSHVGGRAKQSYVVICITGGSTQFIKLTAEQLYKAVAELPVDQFCKLFVIKAFDECDSGITQLPIAQLIVNDKIVLEAVNAYQHTTIRETVASPNAQYI